MTFVRPQRPPPHRGLKRLLATRRRMLQIDRPETIACKPVPRSMTRLRRAQNQCIAGSSDVRCLAGGCASSREGRHRTRVARAWTQGPGDPGRMARPPFASGSSYFARPIATDNCRIDDQRSKLAKTAPLPERHSQSVRPARAHRTRFMEHPPPSDSPTRRRRPACHRAPIAGAARSPSSSLVAIAALAWYLTHRAAARRHGGAGQPAAAGGAAGRSGRCRRRRGRAAEHGRRRRPRGTADIPVMLDALGTVTPAATVTVAAAGLRRDHAGAVQRRPDGQEGPAARDDRSAAVRDGAAAGDGARQRDEAQLDAARVHARSATRRCSSRTRSRARTSTPRPRWSSSSKAPSTIDRANEGTARAEPRLHAHRRAGRRPRRPAPGRRRQLRRRRRRRTASR